MLASCTYKKNNELLITFFVSTMIMPSPVSLCVREKYYFVLQKSFENVEKY